MRLLDVWLALGATLRLTRLVTSDYLGEWWFVGPAKRWAWREIAEQHRPISATLIDADVAVPTPPPVGWRTKLVKGLDCPFCVGFWIGGLVLVAAAVLPRVPVLRTLWRLGAGALALNYVVGHVSSRIDG